MNRRDTLWRNTEDIRPGLARRFRLPGLELDKQDGSSS